MNNEVDWFNDGVWKCSHCESIFKVYNYGDLNDVQGCPYCLVSGAELIPCNENGEEQEG
ncbi:hypothetical protein M5L40_003598 [Clostridium botulinum]|nr:hypothetical protein [Clostridium botulinum]